MHDEAERAAQDAAFCAEKFGLAADDLNIAAIQEQLRQALAQGQQTLEAEQATVANALRAFLTTASWPETRAALEREQALLLIDEADQFLSTLIEQGQQSDDPDAQKKVDMLEAHRQLLRQARASDIPTAWAWFEQEFLTKG